MNRVSILLLLCILVSLGTSGFSQTNNHEPTWAELSKQYEFPKWYTEARFGIWICLGPQSQPESGSGWYARHMYMQDVGSETFGKNAYPYHCKAYGHPSEVGFKDVIHSWKADSLNCDSLMRFIKDIGAKYFMIMANHHDHFDDFNSTYHPWNSVKVGPKRDIVGEFEKSARKYNIPFAVSTHDDRFLNWFLPAFGADTSGVKKGILYDGHLTKADGIGKWWEGLDPADLYGLPPEKRTQEWIESVKQKWLLRHIELVTKYDVDMIWFDGWGFPYGDYGKEVCRTLFSNSLKKNGKIMAVVAGKIPEDTIVIKDIECGSANDIQPRIWQGIITTGNAWFYKKDRVMDHNAQSIIEMLADIISKNGNLVLNIEVMANGALSSDERSLLVEVGEWMKINGEAVYTSKPWKVYGDNLQSYLKRSENITNADFEALKKKEASEQFNQRTVRSLPYGKEEVRFTIKDDALYIFVLNPGEGYIELPALGLNSPTLPEKIKSISLLGSKQKIEFKQNDNNLTLFVPDKRPTNLAAVFKVEWKK